MRLHPPAVPTAERLKIEKEPADRQIRAEVEIADGHKSSDDRSTSLTISHTLPSRRFIVTMLRLTLAAAILSAVALSTYASPLYLSMPSRYVFKAEDYKKNDLDSLFVAPQSSKDASNRALELMLQGRAIRDDDDIPRYNRASCSLKLNCRLSYNFC